MTIEATDLFGAIEPGQRVSVEQLNFLLYGDTKSRRRNIDFAEPKVERLFRMLAKSRGGSRFSELQALRHIALTQLDKLRGAAKTFAATHLHHPSNRGNLYPAIVLDNEYAGALDDPFLVPVWQDANKKKAPKLCDVHRDVIEWLKSLHIVGDKNRHAEDRQLPSKAIQREQTDRVPDDLTRRLHNDYHTVGPYKGQFCSQASRDASAIYQDIDTNFNGAPLPFKPEYYHTYWGWRAALRLFPNETKLWKSHTVRMIVDHFGSGRWIRTQIRNNDQPPNIPYPILETVRHSARAAHILLLLGERGHLVSQVAWDLVHNADRLMIGNGWREYLGVDRGVSLWTSLYIFHFLSELNAEESRATAADGTPEAARTER